MILAIQQAGGVGNGTAIRDALYTVSSGGQSFGPNQLDDALRAIRAGTDIDYDGASGNCDLDDSGNVTHRLHRVEGGERPVQQPRPSAGCKRRIWNERASSRARRRAVPESCSCSRECSRSPLAAPPRTRRSRRTTVTLTFPSTQAAVASDTVLIQVFDETGVAPMDTSGTCEDLVAQVGSSQALPTGAGRGPHQRLHPRRGVRSARRRGSVCAPFLVTTTSNGTGPARRLHRRIGGRWLAPRPHRPWCPLSDAVVVPATTCTSLSEHCCSNGC